MLKSDQPSLCCFIICRWIVISYNFSILLYVQTPQSPLSGFTRDFSGSTSYNTQISQKIRMFFISTETSDAYFNSFMSEEGFKRCHQPHHNHKLLHQNVFAVIILSLQKSVSKIMLNFENLWKYPWKNNEILNTVMPLIKVTNKALIHSYLCRKMPSILFKKRTR